MKAHSAFAAAALLAGSASADLDLSPLFGRVEKQAVATNGKVRNVYAKLLKALSKADRTGLRDDFAKLRAVARAVEGPLSGDAEFAADADAALSEGLDTLVRDAADLAKLAGALDVASDRVRCGTVAATAGRLAAFGETERSRRGVVAGARAALRAAAAYDSGVALADKLFARQNARPPRWSVPLHDLGGALLSTWTTSGPAPDVYAVGASDAEGPLFLRSDGNGWIRAPVAASGALWWVAGVGDSTYAAGTGGRVVRYDPSSDGVTDLSTGIDVTLFGVWGSSTSDVWAVGGNEDGTLPRSALLHHDGASWTSVPLPSAANNRILFKVWGAAADDVWICGQAGLLMHFDGSAWSVPPSDTFEGLFTIHGNSPTIAVGGTVQPALVEKAESGFVVPAIPEGTKALRGVFVLPDGSAWACGLAATVLHRDGGLWSRVASLPPAPARDFHSVRVDSAGGAWFAGGDLGKLGAGVLFYYGPRTPPPYVPAKTAAASRPR